MYAVVQISGFQFRVEQGQRLQVPRQPAGEGETLTLDRVLLIQDDSGVRVGSPTVEGASVTATVVGHGRGPKLRAGKFIRRKDHRKQWGHRQDYTELEIAAIQG